MTPQRIAGSVAGAEPATSVTGRGRDGRDDEAAQLSVVVGQLIRLLRSRAPAAVGPGSLAALATLARHGPMRLGDLAVREGVAPPTLTRMIAVLEDAGYVTRRTDEADRRAVRVSVTDAGVRVVADALDARAEVLGERLARLPQSDRDAIRAVLPALEALADPDR
jgi:DNA-binding MarR family transcriptional regulator